MKNKTYQNLETIATISWLLMDYCWMIGYNYLAWILSFVAIIFSVSSLITYKENIISEKLLLLASIFWILMNSACLYGEDLKILWLLETSKVFFTITLAFVICSIFISRKNKEPLDFKRLKIRK